MVMCGDCITAARPQFYSTISTAIISRIDPSTRDDCPFPQAFSICHSTRDGCEGRCQSVALDQPHVLRHRIHESHPVASDLSTAAIALVNIGVIAIAACQS